MNQMNSATIKHTKNKHLTKEERYDIQTLFKDGWTANRIAADIGCAPNTIRNKIKRGTVTLYHGSVQRCKAEAGQRRYEDNRKNCCRHYDLLSKSDFIAYVETHFYEYGWPLDACVGRALLEGVFLISQIVCTKTLYRYVDLNLLGIKNINLLQKLKRNTRASRIRQNKRILGRSIEDRPREIETREEFGHWECDVVIGSKSGKDDVLLTLSERKSREFRVIPIPEKSPKAVMAAMKGVLGEYAEHVDEVFKTITTDNGIEFSSLTDIEKLSNTLVYFAYPYTSCEKDTVERPNGMIRRFIPKGKRISDYSAEQISQIELWCSSLPRKILQYRTPDEVFEEEIDRIYHIAA